MKMRNILTEYILNIILVYMMKIHLDIIHLNMIRTLVLILILIQT